MDDKRDNINTNNQNQGAQNVRSFGVQNQNSGAEEISERINKSKRKNLGNNKASSPSTKGENSLKSDSTGTANSEKQSLKEKTKEGLKPKNLAKKGASTLGRSALGKVQEDDNGFSGMARTAGKAVDTTKTVKKIVNLLKIPGVREAVIIGIIVIFGLIMLIGIAIAIANPFQLWISSLGMKFGLTSTEVVEMNYSDDEEDQDKIVEGMKRTEIEEAYGDCETSWIRSVANFFGDYDLTNSCEFVRYLKKRVETAERKTRIENIPPGYVINTFYYAYETQNYKEDGTATLNRIPKNADKDDEEKYEIMSDLDAITFLFEINTLTANAKLDNTFAGKIFDGATESWTKFLENTDLIQFHIFTRPDIDRLLEQYILTYDYKYWKWEIVSKEDEPEKWDCVSHPESKNYIDTKKYELYLRYGDKVSVGDLGIKSGHRGYEADKNIVASYNATDPQCIDRVQKKYGEKPGSLEIYDTKEYPDQAGDQEAEITLGDGNKYTYENGFIYDRYPRYMKEFTSDNEEPEFNFVIAKEIEKFIENMRDRQDYSNYLLGYDSDIEKYLDKNNSSSSATVICDYTDVDGSDESGTEENGSSTSTIDTSYKVQLMYPYKDSFSFDAFDFNSNTPMSNELVDIEKYVLGAVFAEAGDTPWQESKFITNSEATSKAFSIMTRSFLMANGTSTTNSGEKVIQIANSTTRQTYCDPDEGCYRCWSNTNNNNIILVPIDNEKAINNNQCTKVEPLPENSKLREYVEATVGQVMTTSSGTVASTQYDNTKLSKWLKEGTPDSSLANYDYTELLYLQYNDKGYSLKGVECRTVYSGGTNYIASGNWDSWKQGSASPWGNQTFGAGATMADAGCLITSFSKLIADANPSTLRIPNFNPGNFAQVLTANNCFEGNNLRNECALKVAVGEGNYTYSAANLSGTFEQKRKLITSFINSGYKVIISVNGDGHWVYVTGTTDTDILMSDPASSHGNSNSVLKTYGNTSAYYKIIKFT